VNVGEPGVTVAERCAEAVTVTLLDCVTDIVGLIVKDREVDCVTVIVGLIVNDRVPDEDAVIERLLVRVVLTVGLPVTVAV
jgi:hypothetical protein